MNAPVATAWAFTLLCIVAAVVALALSIAAYLGWVRIDAVAALAMGLAFASFSLAPMGYAQDRNS